MSGVKIPEVPEDAGFQVIAPPDDLKKKAVTQNKKGFSNERNAINRAEKALEELSTQFPSWMSAEVETLCNARNKIKEDGISDENMETLFLTSHDLKGQAATLGFPAAATLCASLCHLIDTIPDKTRIPDEIIDHHVNAVRAVVRQNVTTMDDTTADALIRKLRSVTEEFLADEIKRAQLI